MYIEWFDVFIDYTSFKIIIKCCLYVLCCTFHPNNLFILYQVVCSSQHPSPLLPSPQAISSLVTTGLFSGVYFCFVIFIRLFLWLLLKWRQSPLRNANKEIQRISSGCCCTDFLMYSWLLLQSKGSEGTNQRKDCHHPCVWGGPLFSWPILAQSHKSSRTLTGSLSVSTLGTPSFPATVTDLGDGPSRTDYHTVEDAYRNNCIHHAFGD